MEVNLSEKLLQRNELAGSKVNLILSKKTVPKTHNTIDLVN